LLGNHDRPIDAALSLARHFGIEVEEPRSKRKVVKEYVYTDADGISAHKTVRYEPKSFSQSAMIDGEWQPGLAGRTTYPYDLPAWKDSPVVYVSEGEKAAEFVKAHGLPSTTLPMGAGKWRDEWGHWFKDKDVRIICDNDGPGQEHGRLLSRKLNGVAASTRTLTPAKAPNGDAVEFFREEWGTPEQLVAMFDAATPALPSPPPSTVQPEIDREDLPLVVLPGGEVGNLEVIRGVVEAITHKDEMFMRGGELVSIAKDDAGSPVFRPISPTALQSEAERYARFGRYVYDKKTQQAVLVTTTLPASTAKIIAAAPELARIMPEVRRICDYRQPVRDGDGIRLLPPGYDKPTGSYTRHDGPELATFPDVPSALAALDEILGEFCYDDSTETPRLFKSSALAYLITAHCRLLVEPQRSPVFFAEGNREGVGKDYFLGLPIVLTVGTIAPNTYAPPDDPAETRKRIFAICRQGERFYIVSNVKRHLDDPAYEAACTSPMFSDRILGESGSLTLPNLAIYGLSGNSLSYSADFARRAIRIRLAYFGESTETRQFQHPDLYGHVIVNRGYYLGALQCLVENWAAKGCPPGLARKNGFNAWAEVIGGILEAAGVPNPIGKDEIVSAPSEEIRHLAALLPMMVEAHGAAEVESGQIRMLATRGELFPWFADDRKGQTSFSKMLARNERRIFDGLRLIKRTQSNRKTLWRVEREGGLPTATSATSATSPPPLHALDPPVDLENIREKDVADVAHVTSDSATSEAPAGSSVGIAMSPLARDVVADIRAVVATSDPAATVFNPEQYL
jgi:hypothetical protein